MDLAPYIGAPGCLDGVLEQQPRQLCWAAAPVAREQLDVIPQFMINPDRHSF
jgi:hypothetical protein